MKNYLIYTLFLTLMILVSCANDKEINLNSEEIDTNSITASISEDSYDGWVVVGKVESGVPVLTVDKNKLIEMVNTNLFEASGKTTRMNEVYLEIFDNSYYLTFKGDKHKASFYVQESKYGRGLMAAGKTVCTTSDCSDEQLGCVAKYPDNLPGREGIGYCTPCANGGGCTKTNSPEILEPDEEELP
jgi:hypothetical protein